jgi:hypothetical protein
MAPGAQLRVIAIAVGSVAVAMCVLLSQALRQLPLEQLHPIALSCSACAPRGSWSPPSRSPLLTRRRQPCDTLVDLIGIEAGEDGLPERIQPLELGRCEWICPALVWPGGDWMTFVHEFIRIDAAHAPNVTARGSGRQEVQPGDASGSRVCDVGSHSRKPPRNALALLPRRTSCGRALTSLALPPPSTM